MTSGTGRWRTSSKAATVKCAFRLINLCRYEYRFQCKLKCNIFLYTAYIYQLKIMDFFTNQLTAGIIAYLCLQRTTFRSKIGTFVPRLRCLPMPDCFANFWTANWQPLKSRDTTWWILKLPKSIRVRQHLTSSFVASLIEHLNMFSWQIVVSDFTPPNV